MSNFKHLNESDENTATQESNTNVPTGIPISYYNPQSNEAPDMAQEYYPSQPDAQNGYIPNQYMQLSPQMPQGNPMVNNSMELHSPVREQELMNAVKFGEIVGCDNQFLSITSRGPQIATCSACKKYVQTIVEYEIGTGTILSGLFVAMLGGWMGCCLVPCFVKDCKDAVHYCPGCRQVLGRQKFIVN